MVQKQTVVIESSRLHIAVNCLCFQRADLFLQFWGLWGKALSPSELPSWQNMTSLMDSAKSHVFKGAAGPFITNALVPSSRLLLWARSILSLKKTSTCPTLSGWQRMIVLRKPKKVGDTDWHLVEGAREGTSQIHISGRLPSPSLCTTLSGHVMCLLMKDWGAVERTWAVESDTSGSITHLPSDLTQILSPL